MSRKKRRESQVEVYTRRAKNLLARAGADRRRLGSIPKEKLLNSCLEYITAIKSGSGLSGKEREVILEHMWSVYLTLQEYDAPERYEWPKNASREVSYQKMVDDISESGDQPLTSANAYSGGLGFKNVSWDAKYWMGNKYKHDPLRGYWNPASGKRDKHGILIDLRDSDYWCV
jgi:hypothetical protein